MNLLNQQILACQKCELRQTCREPVLSSGFEQSKILAIAYKPGADEDLTGFACTGREGQLGRKLYKEIFGETFRFTYLIKCFHVILDKKIHRNACRNWLDSEIKEYKPEILIMLGTQVAKRLGKRGEIIKVGGEMTYLGIKGIISYSLHQCLNNRSKLENTRRLLCSLSLEK